MFQGQHHMAFARTECVFSPYVAILLSRGQQLTIAFLPGFCSYGGLSGVLHTRKVPRCCTVSQNLQL
jgi:hypothetical protein